MLTWTCHICKEERPDNKISVFQKPFKLGSTGKSIGVQNIRYCNDNVSCLNGAKVFEFGGNK